MLRQFVDLLDNVVTWNRSPERLLAICTVPQPSLETVFSWTNALS